MAEQKRRICNGSELVDGGAGVRFDVVRGGETIPAFVIRHGGRVHAYLNRCGHVPIEMDWQKGKFFDFTGLYLVCATHGALYAPESGRCLGGRCNGNGLKAVGVQEHDGGVFLEESE